MRNLTSLKETASATLFGIAGWAVWTYLAGALVYGTLQQPVI